MASRATQLTKTRKQVQTIPNNKKQVQTTLGLQKSRLTYDIASAGALVGVGMLRGGGDSFE